MKIMDLSRPIKHNKSDPGFMKVKIKHKPHKKAVLLLRPPDLPEKLFPRGFEGWAEGCCVPSKNCGCFSSTGKGCSRE